MSTIDLKYTLKTESGKVLYQEIVTFGNKERPIPEDWRNDPRTQVGIYEYGRELLDRMIKVDISEDTEFDIEDSEE